VIDLTRTNILLSEAVQDMLGEMFDSPRLGSPKRRLKKAGYRIVNGKMTAKAKGIIKKITGQFGLEILVALGHTVEPIGV